MNRIERPRWASVPDVWLHEMKLADYEAIQKHRKRMLKVVHNEIESYLNTEGLFYDDPTDGRFPNRQRMTGDYYIADESYAQQVGPVWFQVSIRCHCLGKRVPTKSEPRDYLGLEVWLRCDPKKWTFTVFRNTDSSVI